jgi:hypothetical protein
MLGGLEMTAVILPCETGEGFENVCVDDLQ